MAKKKRRPSHSQATKGGGGRGRASQKARKAEKPAVRDAGASAAFLTGVIAATATAFLFPIWYAHKSIAFRGIDLLLHPTRLPAPIQSGLNGFGGPAAIVVLLVALVAAAGLGFFWSKLRVESAAEQASPLWRRVLTRENAMSVVSLVLATGGLAILLIFLNMQVIHHRQWPVVTEATLLFLGALTALRAVAAVDQVEQRGEPAMNPVNWVIWLGGLTVTAAFHYVWVCYVLIRPAPKALVNGLLARYAR